MARVWQKASLSFQGRSRKSSSLFGHRRLLVERLEDRNLLTVTPYTPIDLGGTFDRIANTRLYEHEQWTLPAETTASVAQALADFDPTEVAGMIHFAVGDVLTQQQIDDYKAVRTAVLAVNPNCKFDFVIDASTITDDGTEAIATMTAVNTELSPDLWFFEYYGPAYATNPEGLDNVIAWAHTQSQAVGGDVYSTLAPLNSDYVAVNDNVINANAPTGNLSFFEINSIKADTNFTKPLPVIAHVNSIVPTGSDVSVPQVFINPTGNPRYWNQAMRIAYITTLANHQVSQPSAAAIKAAWRYSLMYPIFAPQYPIGQAYDSTQDVSADLLTTTYAQMQTLADTYNPVDRAASTTVLTSSATDPQYAGQALTLTATITVASGTPTGKVSFYDGSVWLAVADLNGSGVATLTTTSLTPGAHTLYATYEGDSSFRSSTSVGLSQTITAVIPTRTILSGPSTSIYGRPITLTAYPLPARTGNGTPSGTMVFKDNGTVIGTVTLDVHGMARLTGVVLSAGSHKITAVYSGSPAFVASTSATLRLTVTKAVTRLTLTSSLPTATVGQTVKFTAQVSPTATGVGVAVGTVKFYDGNRLLATVALDGTGKAEYSLSTLSKGRHRIRAVYTPTTVNTFIGSSSSLLQRILPL